MAFSFFKKTPAPQVETRKPVRPTAPAAATATASRPPDSMPASDPPSSAGLMSLDFVSRDPLEGARRAGKGELQVQDVSSGLHPVVEEAAMLFANGDDEAALSTLERATFGDLGSSTEQVWAMLFDLCHALGRVDIVAGPKADAMANRLAYDGVPFEAVDVDLIRGFEAFLALPAPSNGVKTVVFTSRSMRKIRGHYGLTSEEVKKAGVR